MKRSLPQLLCLLLILSLARADDGTNAPITNLPVTPEIEMAVARAMTNCPAPEATLHEEINTNGVYTLVGDLFHNGHTNALIDNTNNILLGEWDGAQWKAKTVINAAPIWKATPTIDDRWTGEAKATSPFYILSLQGYPIVVVGAVPYKYGQEYDCLLLDPKKLQILNSVTGYAVFDESKPHVQENYLVTYDASRHKATWDETYFYKVRDKKLHLEASYGGYCLYNPPTPEEFPAGCNGCDYASYGKTNYSIIPDYSDSNPKADFVIFTQHFDDSWHEIVNAHKINKPFAKIYFTPKTKEENYASDIFPKSEISYLTWKLTRLPRKLVRTPDNKNVSKYNIESLAKIKVTGSPEAVKLLSP